MTRLLLYSLISLLVLGPLFGRGYILTLDMVFTPELRLPDHMSSSYLFHALLHYLNILIPSDIIQKILLLTTFVTAGWGAHSLTAYIQQLPGKAAHRLVHRKISRVAAGSIYIINPFTYERLMTGQYAVLLGYALLPWFVRCLLDFLYRPRWITTVRITLITVAIGIVSVHTLGAVAAVVVIGAIGAFVRHGLHTSLKLYGLQVASGLITFTLLSAYWLIPLITGSSRAAQHIGRFSEADRLAFATSGSTVIAKVANVLQLRGFWAERHDLFTLPWAKLGLVWYFLGLCVIVLVITGIVSLWQNGQTTVSGFFIAMIVSGALCAAGVLVGNALTHTGLLAGFREPQKFTMLIALSYSICFGLGVASLVAYWSKVFDSMPSHAGAASVCLVVPFVWTMVMLAGCNGQLTPRQYPEGWFAVNDALNRQNATQTLFLPWHLYMHFDFAGRTIASPATDFFDKPVIVSDDPEIGGAVAEESSEHNHAIDKLLANPPRDFTARLKKLGISHLILAKEHDYQAYQTITQQPGVEPILRTPTITLYSLQSEQEPSHAPGS